MNVVVYSGPEVVQASLNGALTTLKSILQPHYSVQTVSQQALSSQPWFVSCALLVLPECWKPFQSKSTSAIQSFVENGGAFLGLSIGAKYSTHGLDPEISSLSIGSGSTEPLLRFRHITKGGYLYPTYSMSGTNGEKKIISVQVQDGDTLQLFETSRKEFLGIDKIEGGKPLATYIDDEAEPKIASLIYELGRGKVILWGPGLEYPLSDAEPSSEDMTGEQGRYKLFESILSKLSLQIPSQNTKLITHPLPQFLMGHPSKPGILPNILSLISVGYPPPTPSIFKDSNDIFHFHAFTDSAAILQQARSDKDQAADPANWQPKHIIVCPDGELPPPEYTPLFDCKTFFDTLTSSRVEDGLLSGRTPWGIGDAFIYGEVVTSTQTMLDKNPHLLSSLPTPFVSMASYQLAGRGRGANVWLSPAGCLQFSILLRVPLANFPASKLVFVQYLFALAVAEACRAESVLGSVGNVVRLKWPNDLYAVSGDGSDSKKIGGILVNTSFTGGNVDIVIGCGINVLNAPPIASLAQLLGPSSDRKLTMEATLAAVLTTFEKMWDEFIKGKGSFEPFMNLYLSRWLHSDQLVTVTTMKPHQRVRIVGITTDHGLLRTMPVSDGFSANREPFVDLQPDGNSFDLMAGMIKTKT